jgi:hypothetical protein
MSSRNPIKLPHVHFETIVIAILIMVVLYIALYL